MKTILVPVDFSDATEPVVETAKRIAGPFKSRIILLHVAEPEPDFIGFEPGPITVRIQQLYFDAVHGRVPQYHAWLSHTTQMQTA